MPALTSSESIQLTLTSFDPKCRDFEFLRTIPVAVYVDAGELSAELGRGLLEILARALSEKGFEIQELRNEKGSFCQLNICQSKVPLDEKSLFDKIRDIQEEMYYALQPFPIKEGISLAGSAAVAVVAVGQAVHFIQATNPETFTIGSYIFPISMWVPLLVTKEGREFLKESGNIFTKGKRFKRALKQAIKDAKERSKNPAIAEKQRNKEPALLASKDEKISELRTALRKLQERLDRLENE
jgi:hypothetical protein